MTEIWKPIIMNDVNTGYEVSSLKRVRSKNKILKVNKKNHFCIFLNGKRIGCSSNNLYNLYFRELEYFYYNGSKKIYLSLDDLEKLEWTPINEISDYYISIYGIIKSLKNKKVYYICREPHKCNGYVYITLYSDAQRKTFRLHKLVMMVYSIKINKTDVINHINGCKYDNRLKNLEYCSKSENALHAVKMGLVGKRIKFKDPDNRIIDNEIWKGAFFYTRDMLLIDFSQNYEVSNIGRIRNLHDGKIHLGKITKDNYHVFTLSMNGIRYHTPSHRIVSSTFLTISDITNNIVDHINGNRLDNQISNLRWCNSKINSQNRKNGDRVINNRFKPLDIHTSNLL